MDAVIEPCAALVAIVVCARHADVTRQIVFPVNPLGYVPYATAIPDPCTGMATAELMPLPVRANEQVAESHQKANAIGHRERSLDHRTDEIPDGNILPVPGLAAAAQIGFPVERRFDLLQ